MVKVRTVPILIHYRYILGDKDATVRFYIGPSVGFTLIQMSEDFSGIATLSGVPYTYTAHMSKSTTGFTWGGTAGVLWKISKRMNADIGYHFMDTNVKIKDFGINTSLNINMISAGVSFKY